jgi:hypothetical protein
MSTIYISIQRVDYDDYPVGQDTKVGPFESIGRAEEFAAGIPEWNFRHGYGSIVQFGGRAVVAIKDLKDTFMIDPERYLERLDAAPQGVV